MSKPKRELVLGAGNCRKKLVYEQNESQEYEDPTYLDVDPDSKPDMLYDCNLRPFPWPDNTFDQIHAYSILEHLGTQGDWRGFFEEFSEYWRLLKPDGQLRIIAPKPEGPWAWGDPGHTRVIGLEQLTFLAQAEYEAQVGKNSMSDYRHVYQADFVLLHEGDHGPHDNAFVLQAVKVSTH